MKSFITVLFMLATFSAQASGWIEVDVLPGSVLTRTWDGRHVAIFKEKGTLPPTGYECTLNVEADEQTINAIARSERQGSWTCFTTTERLSFADVGVKFELRLDPDRSSACLEWGEEYYEDGFPTRDCIRHAASLRTMKNILVLRDRQRKLSATISCEKWLSDKRFESLDDFFHIISRAESHFPLFLDAELD